MEDHFLILSGYDLADDLSLFAGLRQCGHDCICVCRIKGFTLIRCNLYLNSFKFGITIPLTPNLVNKIHCQPAVDKVFQHFYPHVTAL
jgi:hypothetical protein